MEKNKDILSAADMARELNMGLPFIYRELKAGRIPSTRVGDRYFIHRTAWERYLSGDRDKVGAC